MNVQIQLFCCPADSSVYLTFELLFNVKKKKEKNLIDQQMAPILWEAPSQLKPIVVKSLQANNMHIWGLFYSQEDIWQCRPTSQFTNSKGDKEFKFWYIGKEDFSMNFFTCWSNCTIMHIFVSGFRVYAKNINAMNI